MKTPWKFLVELTSRRRPAKGRENSIGHATDLQAPDHEAEQTPEPSSTESSASANHDEAVPVEQAPAASNEREDSPQAGQALARPADDEEAWSAIPNEARHSDTSADLPTRISETSEKSQRKPPPQRRERAKRTQATVVAQSAVATHEGQCVQPSSSPDAFFDEMASLDEDIKKLRSELARKLQLQNAQLKKMLKRFDVS
ncbi:hypothetical protein [Rhizobium fabae]|uniref:Uncharacterized protein n=1 Tax=Rhizobium fabae TaxID=573179 RepID=A0A7W6BJR9_9HYPH|nr:hypothetical protein [Rhizobium fabae]MBB3918691.1 hypothetical protein [Rhizobium fabae]